MWFEVNEEVNGVGRVKETDESESREQKRWHGQSMQCYAMQKKKWKQNRNKNQRLEKK